MSRIMSIITGMVLIVSVSIMLIAPVKTMAQVAENISNLENFYTIHTPTAGVMKKGQYGIDINTFGNGGFVGGISVGLFDRFHMGISYGGEKLIGYDEPKGNELPGVQVRYRIWEESEAFPAITFGFEMQGHGRWNEDINRYDYKAPGLFAAMSKNWQAFSGQAFGVHAGVNLNSIEDEDQQGMDVFVGMNLGLNEQLTALVEYDFALDDNKTEKDSLRYGSGLGYLNAGVRLTIAQSLVIEAFAIDLLQNSEEYNAFGRELRLTYVETFKF